MKSFDGWQRMLAFCILLVYGTMLLPAQEIYLSRQLGGMYLEQYLDRADLERSQQRWQQLADQGVLVALSAWRLRCCWSRRPNYGWPSGFCKAT